MEDPVIAALHAAQIKGKPTMNEMIELLDWTLTAQCSDMRALAVEYNDSIDWETWGRRAYVLEETLGLLKRLNDDPEVRSFLRRKTRELAAGISTTKPESPSVGDPQQNEGQQDERQAKDATARSAPGNKA